MLTVVRGFSLLVMAGVVTAQERSAFQNDLWREYDFYRDRLMQLARAIPEDKFDWRPGEGVRSVREVLLHVSLNNYMLLDMMGRPVPADLFPGIPTSGNERRRAIIRRNQELEKQIVGKQAVLAAVEGALAAGAEPIRDSPATDLNKPAMFGNRKTTAGGLQLRAVAHLHEHYGQLIAYARSVGVVPPWSQQ